jgi:uncharacterized membrane protein YfcA
MKYWSPWLFVFTALWLLGLNHFANAPFELFSSNWPFIFVGFGAAILGNISAVGGGIIFIPAMMFIFHVPPVVALKVALLSQCFGMTSGAIGWLQRQKIPGLLFALTIPALLIGSTISSLLIHPSPLLVKVFFGPVSILLGIITLLSLKHKSEIKVEEFSLDLKGRVALFFISLIGGLITGWVAIGEGEVVSGFLMLVYQLSTSVSIALGVVLLAINSLYLGVIHQFFLGGLPWEIAGFTGLGCVFGARLAPFIGQKFKSNTLKYIFAVIAIGDGLLFIFQYLFSKMPH